MAQEEDAIAIGIGPQAARGTADPFVAGATDLIVGPAEAGLATGILLRNPEDLSKSMARIQTDLGVITGSRTRATGGFIRVEPTVSFDIDLKGNGGTATPSAGEYDALEYMLQILQGHRLIEATPGGTSTAYQFGTPSAAQQYKTLKIWRGPTESWVLQDCQFNLTWTFVAGEKAVMTVDVLSGPVTHSIADTFPASPDFGTQVDAPPIGQQAGASIDSQVRGFTSATITSAYPVIDVPDINAEGGILKELGTPRDIQFTADWYGETGEDDFALLTQDAGVPVFFTIGQSAGATDTIEAWRFDMPLFRGEVTDKVDSEGGKVLRTITGYASHTVGDDELQLTAV